MSSIDSKTAFLCFVALQAQIRILRLFYGDKMMNISKFS